MKVPKKIVIITCHAAQGVSFSFETTLSGLTYVRMKYFPIQV